MERRLREEGELAQRLSSRNTDLQVPVSSPVPVGEHLRLTVGMDGTRLEQHVGLIRATYLSSNWTSCPQGVSAGFKTVAVQPCSCLTRKHLPGSVPVRTPAVCLYPAMWLEHAGHDKGNTLDPSIQRKKSHRITPPPLLYIGWVGVGWQRHSKTRRSLREVDNQGTVFFLFRGGGSRPQRVVELDHLCEVNNLVRSAHGNLSYHVPGSVQGKAPKRQWHGTPITLSLSGCTGN